MNNFPILCLLLCIPHLLLGKISSSVLEERHHLFMLAILSYLHHQSEVSPKSGHDIAALIAWDVEELDKTPEFVIDKNRNFERQGAIFHAEIMAIEQAAQKQFDPHIEPSKLAERQYSRRLANAILYGSLEPCPFCMAGIAVARIPNVVYFMEDPALRDGNTGESLFPLPAEFLGKKSPACTRSSLPMAEHVHQELRALAQEALDFRLYFEEHSKQWWALGAALFASYEVVHPENSELYGKLAKAVQW